MAKDWLPVMIDTDRMIHGKEFKERMKGGGPPWLAILAADGKKLITSDGPKGNIGCPIQPHEIDHFLVMLKTTRQHASDAELAEIEQELRTFAKPYQRPARER